MVKTERRTATLFVYLPKSKKVILSRRGEFERHPGLLQATLHAPMEPGEIPQLALKREFKEELKGKSSLLIKKTAMGEATVGSKTIEHTFYFAAQMDDDFVSLLQPPQEVSELVMVSESDLAKVEKYSKHKQEEDAPRVDFSDRMIMFDDELEVLKKVFKEFA